MWDDIHKTIAIFVEIHKNMRFDELDLEYEILDGLEAMNFSEATPIQEATIPLLLEGRDMIACAQTGTGKTAAYLLPIINKISRDQSQSDKVTAIIMAPTRELAIQIEQQVEGFAYFLPISSVAIYGGTDGITFEQQKRGLLLGADIIIATPGRILSMLSLQDADLSEVSYFVLDEADRMLDMGFMDDIMQIYKLLPTSCQTVMFSATMPPKIRKLAKSILKKPAEVTIAISRPPESIRQGAYICYEPQKLPIIRSIFENNPPERCIIFCSSKLKVKELARTLSQGNIKVAAMHSDLAQSEREVVMRDFKNGHIQLLVATDIVARGIDVDNIEMVINYDIPHDPEDYVHRIGRTARGGNDNGTAITLVGLEDQYEFACIEKFLGKTVEKLGIPEGLGQSPEYAPRPRGNKSRPSRNKGKQGANKVKSHSSTDKQAEGRDTKSDSQDEQRASKGKAQSRSTQSRGARRAQGQSEQTAQDKPRDKQPHEVKPKSAPRSHRRGRRRKLEEQAPESATEQ